MEPPLNAGFVSRWGLAVERVGAMFRLVRLFLITSAAVAVAIFTALAVYRESEVQRLIEYAERQNVNLARSFANSIWPNFSFFVMSASGEDARHESEEMQAITRAVEAATAGLPVLKVKIYNLEGLTVYSSYPAEIGEYKTNNPGIFAAARGGHPASKLTFRNSISSFEQTVQEWDLVESYLPIRQGDGPVEGVLELYTDVTPLMASMRQSATNLMLGFFPVFGLLYGVLFLIVRRAEQTIKQQYTAIAEKNLALSQAREKLERRVAERTRKLTAEINQRKQMQDEIQQQRNELAHVGRVSMIGEMATSLAHELNQPLTVISGCVQFCLNSLRCGAVSQEKFCDSMTQAVEQADRATKIVRRVRDFVHKGQPKREQIDFNDAIRAIAPLLRSDAREHGVEVELDLAETMLPVKADPIELQQVVLNLAHNGIEAMAKTEAASRRLSIRTCEYSHGGTEVIVRDHGSGVPSEVREHMFDPFVTTKPHGLGMGLSISRSIIEAHGGRIWFTTSGTNGSTFHFILPASEGESSNDK